VDPLKDGGTVTVRGTAAGFEQHVTIGRHRLTTDEPEGVGGSDRGPDPYSLILAALGSCTSMTVGLYARRRHWDVGEITIHVRQSRVHAEDCASCNDEQSMIHRIELEIGFGASLTAEQRQKLLEIANRCPVHRTLTSKIEIRTSVQGVGG
jgi:putative redox protein